MSLESVAQPAEAPVVALESGPVTLVALDQLIQRRKAIAAETREADAHVAQLVAQANADARDAAAYLVAQRTSWESSAFSSELVEIDSRKAQIDGLDADVADLDAVARHGFTGFFRRFADRQKRVRLVNKRNALAAEVSAALSSLGLRVHSPMLLEADGLLNQAQQKSREAEAIRTQVNANTAAIQAMDDEISRRQKAMKQLGFDALWTAAWLARHEPPAINSPVALRKGEAAWISVPASLSRQATQTRWTGSSQGVSFPIGHTGIRYRVGAYRGHPIQTSVIRPIDTGSLVVTNQRVVFIGRIKSVAISLSHLVHVEAYTDALAVFQDRREAPDFFNVQAPQYVLFYVNYALGRVNAEAGPAET